MRFRSSEAVFEWWRVMDSNQRRTTPTVLQGCTTTHTHLQLSLGRQQLFHVFATANRTPSLMLVDDWTPGGDLSALGRATQGEGSPADDSEFLWPGPTILQGWYPCHPSAPWLL